MPPQLCLVALNPTDSVTEGFLPAAAALGLDVTLLTDQPDAHRAAYAGRADAPTDVEYCQVRDFRELVGHVERLSDRHDGLAAVFSNSDHLQTQTALAAGYLSLPAKDWHATLRVKNKALMRRHLARQGIDTVRSQELLPGNDNKSFDVPFPCVVKPREGVASEDVVLVANADELAAAREEIRLRKPETILVAEEFLAGELRTLETIGDGGVPRVLGGFRTTLSPPPYFIEETMVFDPTPPDWQVRAVLAQLAALGVGFGACHTEYMVDGDRIRLVEVNYRAIGDQCDLLLADLTGVPFFESVLRVHLGESLPADLHIHTDRYARIEYRCADRGGRLLDAPPAMNQERDGVFLTYRPLREIGVERAVTNTNRDYLGVLRAIGTDQSTVDRVSAGFLAEHEWVIQP
jgi:biotin carboxylase